MKLTEEWCNLSATLFFCGDVWAALSSEFNLLEVALFLEVVQFCEFRFLGLDRVGYSLDGGQNLVVDSVQLVFQRGIKLLLHQLLVRVTDPNTIGR